MRVLGVDPGSWRTGWGLIEGTRADLRMLECGRIRLSAGATMARRMAELRRAVDALIGRLEPTSAAVETPFHGVNPRSALQLAHARGVILACLAAGGLEVAEYSPATIKKSVAGNGRATKEQVQRMVGMLLQTSGARPSVDASDALAVALCHAASSAHRARLEQSVKGRA